MNSVIKFIDIGILIIQKDKHSNLSLKHHIPSKCHYQQCGGVFIQANQIGVPTATPAGSLHVFRHNSACKHAYTAQQATSRPIHHRPAIRRPALAHETADNSSVPPPPPPERVCVRALGESRDKIVRGSRPD